MTDARVLNRNAPSNSGLAGRMRALLKFCSAAILVVLVIMALGPENWQPRTGIGWGFDHFVGYFVITIFVCLAWPRPLVVGGAIMAFGSLLEFLQAFTPDRSSNLMAAIYGAGGALAAALVAELYIRAFSTKAGKAGILENQSR
jgi:VanZ family protein